MQIVHKINQTMFSVSTWKENDFTTFNANIVNEILEFTKSNLNSSKENVTQPKRTSSNESSKPLSF